MSLENYVFQSFNWGYANDESDDYQLGMMRDSLKVRNAWSKATGT